MPEKDSIRITSKGQKDLSTKVIHRGQQYYVITDFDPKTPLRAKTSIYNRGQVVKVIKHTIEGPKESAYNQIKKAHRRVAERVKKGLLFAEEPKALYRELRKLIAKDHHEEAEEIVRIALEDWPDEPVLRSFWGYLVAKEKKNIQDGITHCREALKTALRNHQPEVNIALIYLNLGRVHLLNNDRRSAIRAFKSGLGYDPGNEELNDALVSLGIRKKPVIGFLPRSHPINKYLGLLRERLFYRKKK